jgi:hypothetical protein
MVPFMNFLFIFLLHFSPLEASSLEDLNWILGTWKSHDGQTAFRFHRGENKIEATMKICSNKKTFIDSEGGNLRFFISDQKIIYQIISPWVIVTYYELRNDGEKIELGYYGAGRNLTDKVMFLKDVTGELSVRDSHLERGRWIPIRTRSVIKDATPLVCV